MMESAAPLVSIIMPAFNAETVIATAIRSVMAQDEPSWELIVVDDCSKDRTSEIVRGMEDPRIRLLMNCENLGPAFSRARAVSESRGRFVAFLDSDDWWSPHKLRRQLEFTQQTGAGLCYTGFRKVTSDRTEGRLITVPSKMTYRRLLGNTAIATSTVLLDRSKTGKIEIVDGYGYDDFILWLSLVKNGVLALGLNEDLCRYRITPGSYSRNKFRSAAMVWRIYREVEHLPLLSALWFFASYALHAVWKYRKL